MPLSEGFSVARVCMFNEFRHSNLPVYKVSGEGIEKEAARMDRAVAIAGERLDNIAAQVRERIGPAEAEIFVAQRMILNDPSLHTKVDSLIRNDAVNAETAVARVLDDFETRVLSFDDEYLRERASDFGEVKRRILDVLGNMRPELQCTTEGHCQKGKNRIIVAEELTPMLTVELDVEHVMGFVTERGGVNSHAAILARAMGVPAVSGVTGIRTLVGCGTEILINGHTGEVIIRPTEQTLTQAKTEVSAVRMPLPVDPVPGYRVMANINTARDVAEVLQMRAEGIGLYRTEIELIAAGRKLEEDELAERYGSVVKAMQGRPVVFRMFDIGSDKTVPFLKLPREGNPALGWRGVRLLLGHPELLGLQARALARASQHGPVRVMYPMIVDADQFSAVKRAFLSAIEGVPAGELLHGTMFEVPSACLQARELMEVADFGSIGTNDLLQYLFAVDRDNERVAGDYRPGHAVLWKLIADIVAAGRAAGKEISLCGEVAAEPIYLPRLMAAGIRAVSVNTRRIPAARVAAGEYMKLQKEEEER